MAEQATALELATNIPCRANLKYVNWRSTSHGERLKLVVDVAPHQEQYPAGRCEAWASIDFEAPMISWGLIQRSGTNSKNQPDFKVLNSPIVILHMRERKGEKGMVKYLTLGVERNGQVQYFDPSAEAAPPAPAPATPAPSSSNGNGGAAEHVTPPTPDGAKARARELMLAIGDLHFACELLIRERRATVGDDGKREELSLALPLEQSDAAMVNSLFIEVNRAHVQAYPGIHRDVALLLKRRREAKPTAAAAPPPPPPPPAPAPRPAPARAAAGPGMESFADFPEALDGDDDDLPF